MKKDAEMFQWTEWPGELLPLDAHKIIQHRYRRAASLAQGKDVLEVGCGSGIGLAHVSKFGRSVVGLEYSAQNIERLKMQKYCTFPVVSGDAEKLPFQNNSFDLIIALAMIYYVDFESFIQSAQRVLRPGGRIFFCTSNKNVPGFVPALHTKKYFAVPEITEVLSRYNFEACIRGAFVQSSEPLFYRRSKALVKTGLKRVVQKLPNGEKIWHGLRLKTLGTMLPLPESIETEDLDDIKETILDPLKIDACHRVIYVEACLLEYV